MCLRRCMQVRVGLFLLVAQLILGFPLVRASDGDMPPVRVGDLRWHIEAGSTADGTVGVEPGFSGNPMLVAGASPNSDARWMSEPIFTSPGAAYRLSANVKSTLGNAHGWLELIFLDASGRQVGLAKSRPIFDKHDSINFSVTAVAPVGSRHAVAQIVVVHDDAKSRGKIYVSKIGVGPTIKVVTGMHPLGYVLAPGEKSVVTLGFSGVDATVNLRTQWWLSDFDGSTVKGTEGNTGDITGRELTLELPALPSGYYTLSARVSGQGLAPAEVELSFAVVEGGRAIGPTQQRFGLDAALSRTTPFDKERVEQSVFMARLAGVGMLRDRFDWQEMEPAKGKLVWGRFEIASDIQAKSGMKVLPVVIHTPTWARWSNDSRRISGRTPPQDPFDVYFFVKKLVKAMGHKVPYIEIWNEPNMQYFEGRPESYAAILKAAYLGAKDADPSVGVLIGSAADKPGAFYERLYENGVGDYFDIYNQHFYGPPEQLFSFLPDIVGTQLRRFGLEKKPLWITETGKSAQPDENGSFRRAERQQASYLVRAYVSAFANGADRVFYFFLNEFLEQGNHLWGILRDGLSPKPAYVALATLTRQLGSAVCIGWKEVSGGYAVFFQKGNGEIVAVIWGAKGVNFELPAAGPVFDVVGRTVPANPTQSGVQGVLGDNPVYVHGIRESVVAERGWHPVAPAIIWKSDASPVPNLQSKRVWLQLEVNRDGSTPAFGSAANIEKERGVLVEPEKPFGVVAWVNNFSDHGAVATVTCEPDSRFTVLGARQVELAVKPWQRMRYEFRVVGNALAVGQVKSVNLTMSTMGHIEKGRVYLNMGATDFQGTRDN